MRAPNPTEDQPSNSACSAAGSPSAARATTIASYATPAPAAVWRSSGTPPGRKRAKLVLGARAGLTISRRLQANFFLGDGCAVCIDVTKRAEVTLRRARRQDASRRLTPAACRQDALFRAVATQLTAPSVAWVLVMFSCHGGRERIRRWPR